MLHFRGWNRRVPGIHKLPVAVMVEGTSSTLFTPASQLLLALRRRDELDALSLPVRSNGFRHNKVIYEILWSLPTSGLNFCAFVLPILGCGSRLLRERLYLPTLRAKVMGCAVDTRSPSCECIEVFQ